MNLRSGACVDLKTTRKEKKKASKQGATPRALTMDNAVAEELKKLMLSVQQSLSSQLTDFRSDFTAFRADTERDIKLVMQQGRQMSEDLEKVAGRLEHVEHRVGAALDTGILHHNVIKSLVGKIAQIEERTEYLENKSRQNNLRIFHIPERSEGKDMIAFLKHFFQEILHLTEDIDVIRAHRLYKDDNSSGRPIIAAFRDFDMKKKVISAAWKQKEIMFKGTRIFFEHDFTPRVYQQRASYRTIRKQLKEKNIKSHILVPAKLKVFYEDGTAQIFDNLQAAIKCLEGRGLIHGATSSESQHKTGEQLGATARQQESSGQSWEIAKIRHTNENVEELMLRAERSLGL